MKDTRSTRRHLLRRARLLECVLRRACLIIEIKVGEDSPRGAFKYGKSVLKHAKPIQGKQKGLVMIDDRLVIDDYDRL